MCPLDNELSTAAEIANANFSLIDECDIIIADCNSFRGQEPDSGTMCEIGYGIAKGKTIVCYMDNIMPMRNRYGTVDKNGMSYENFGYPLNLMIATKAIIVEVISRTPLKECVLINETMQHFAASFIFFCLNTKK